MSAVSRHSGFRRPSLQNFRGRPSNAEFPRSTLQCAFEAIAEPETLFSWDAKIAQASVLQRAGELQGLRSQGLY